VHNNVAINVRNNVEDNVHHNARDDVRNTVWDRVLENVAHNVADAAHLNVRDTVWRTVVANIPGDGSNNVADNVHHNVRDNVRENVADLVARNLHNNVAINVRNNVAGAVRDRVAETVRNDLRYNVADSVRYNVYNNVHNNVATNVRDNVAINVRNNVYNTARDNVHHNVATNVRERVLEPVRSNVSWSVAENVAETVRNDVADNLHYYPGSYCNVSDYGWLAYYSFFEQIGLNLKNEAFGKFRDLINTGLYDTIQLDGLCVVSEMPIILERSPTGQLHSTTGPAIAWSDGYEIYALNGVMIDGDLYNQITNKTLSAKEALTISNVQVRMEALKFLGSNQLLTDLGATPISTELGYELFKIEGVFDVTEYCLRYSCPSTGQIYVDFIDPIVGARGDAISAVASKWRLSRSEFLSLEKQT